MSYDVGPGQPYQTWVRIFDVNGSPVLAGVVGTMTLSAPGSTAEVGVATALTHLGDGRWGATWVGDLLRARGTYRWATSAITGAASMEAQEGTFEVGVGDQWSLRELFTSVRRGCRDGWTGTTTTGGSATTAVCKRFAYGSDNAWKSSELFVFEPLSVTDLNPVRVTGFAAASGTFAFAGQNITPTIAGQDFIVGNKDGQGFAHDDVMDAIITAVRRFRQLRRVYDQVSIVTGGMNTYEFALPADWVNVDAVSFRPSPGVADTQWVGISPVYWRVPDNRNVLAMDTVPWGCPLRLEGWAVPALPDGSMNQLIHVPGATVRDDAVYELLSGSDKRGDQSRAAMMAGAVQSARATSAFGRL